MAHYDTKSQLLPTGLRVACVVAVTAAACALAAIALMPPIFLAPFSGTLAALALAALVLLLANLTGNRSPGALDNATGVATLLELARSFRPTADSRLELHWVATGAEELALDGARAFVRRHEAWCRQRPTLFVNLDSIGAGDRILLAGEPAALALAHAAAAELDLPAARLRVLGAGMDHEPFAACGLPAVSLLGDVVAASLRLHSRRDTLDRVDLDALDRAARLAERIAHNWAERHQPALSTPRSHLAPADATLLPS
jgi:Zn-dependent M28 family amino/carboxypeptidase